MSRPPRISNGLSWEKGTIYFVTFCVTNRTHVLANHRAWNICRATFARLDQWTILPALAMPDHVHALISPHADRDASISGFAKWFKRWFNEAFWNRRPSVLDGRQGSWQWQEGCFDRPLCSDESLSEKWEYIRQNPVRAGLVTDPDEWPYQYQL